MKNKLSIITTGIAASVIFTSIFTFSSFAASTGPAQLNMNNIQLNAICQKANQAQNSNNQQFNIKSADIMNMLQNNFYSKNCNKIAVKTNNFSALQSQLDSLLKANYGASATKPISNAVATKPACKKNSPKPTTAPTATPAPKPTTSPTATPAPKPTTAPTSGNYSAFQQKILELVNVERANNGLKSLTMNAELSKVATLKSKDMANLNYFSHTSPTYGSPFEMMKQFGISYRAAGENIAMGQTSPEQVMQGWMNSPGHRANILNASFTQLGVGVAKDSNGRIYWTQQFIG